MRAPAMLMIAALGACQREARSPSGPPATAATGELGPGARPALVQSSGAASLSLPPVVPRQVSSREQELIDEVVAMFPGTRGADLRQDLLDPRMGTPRVVNSAAAQSVLDRIAAVRAARADSVTAAQRDLLHLDVPATVVLDEKPRDATATATVLRRARQEPHDVILLPRGGATIEALGAAFRALVAARRRDGEEPARDEVLVVHGRAIPESWRRADQVGFAQDLVARLVKAEPSSVAGLGTVRSVRMHIARSRK